jgi:hypothetical protein
MKRGGSLPPGEGTIMPRTRPVPRTVLIATAATTATAFALGGCAAHSSPGGRLGDPALVGTVYSGQGTANARVVVDAVGDHRESMGASWSASLIEVPTALLGGNAGCGRQVIVSSSSGTSVTAVVVGSCGSCSGYDIQLSPALFSRLAPLGQLHGSLSLTWKYVS